MRIEITTKPTLEAITYKWDERRKKLVDTKPANKKVAVHLDQWVQRNFKDEGSKLGSDKWKKLLLGGRYTKGIFDPSAKLLQDTGRLKFSFLPFATRATAGIGSDLKYSKTHDEGTTKISKRRILPKPKEVEKRIREILEMHAEKALGIK